MKAIVLCGGLGTRLFPITLALPKQLIPIGTKPILFYIIDSLLEADINDIGVIYNNDNRQFADALEKYKNTKANIKFIKQNSPIGLANAVLSAEEFVGDDDFIMILGDNFYELSIEGFVKAFRDNRSNCHILLKEVSDPHRFGIAKVEGDKIVDVVEKPKNPPTNLAITGIYAFDKNILQGCKSIEPSWRGEYEITDAIKWLLSNDYKVSFEVIKGKWSDVGQPKDILEANSYILSNLENNLLGEVDDQSNITNKAYLGKNSKLINTTVRGPVYIGDNVTIENSYLGPYTSIHDNVYVSNCSIENSIILDNSNITNIDTLIDSSIIGKNTSISRHSGHPKANVFLISNDSKISLD